MCSRIFSKPKRIAIFSSLIQFVLKPETMASYRPAPLFMQPVSNTNFLRRVSIYVPDNCVGAVIGAKVIFELISL